MVRAASIISCCLLKAVIPASGQEAVISTEAPSGAIVIAERQYRPAATEVQNQARRYLIRRLDFNSQGMDFSPVPFRDGIAFVSSRDKRKSGRQGSDTFLSLFYVREAEDGTFTSPEPLNRSDISAYHEGPVVFFEKGTRMIFTRNSFVRPGKRKEGEQQPLELAESILRDGKWSEPQTLPFAGKEFSVGHPALDHAGSTLYFSSNMPGSQGESDIFVSRLVNGSWSPPENMGPAINTSGQELFPFVYNDSLLFFSSNGRGGQGGLDIFYCKIRGSDRTVHSLDAPVNSSADDFGIYIEEGGQSGFFSSNRSGGLGQDDVYSFEEIRPFVSLQLCDSLSRRYIPAAKLTIRDPSGITHQSTTDISGESQFRLSPLTTYALSVAAPGYQARELQLQTYGDAIRQKVPVRIYLQPLVNTGTHSVVSGLVSHNRTNVSNVISFSSSPLDVDVVNESTGPARGENKPIPTDSTSGNTLRIVVVEIINELPEIVLIRNDSMFTMKPLSESLLKDSQLNLEIVIPQGAKRHVYEEIIRKQTVAQGYDVAGFLLIRSFFFDSGKAWIRNDACAQLDKIIEVMASYPRVDLEMIFHADSRGTEKFNLELSRKRAAEVSAYLQKAGISQERIVATFVGESQLLNDCGDLADCDELLHQINRTAEFKLIVR